MMRRLLAEGTMAGTVGATVVAVWFLFHDVARGEPFKTPAVLGAVLFQGLRDLGALRITTELVLEYSAVHWIAFLLFGWVAAALLAGADREPRLFAALVVLFCCFEVLALALIAVLAEWLFEALPQWTIVLGNLMAAAAMLGALMRRHRVAWRAFLTVAE